MAEHGRAVVATRRPRWTAYLLAVLLTVATVAVRLAFGFTPGDPPTLIFFLVPILTAGYVGGSGPGLTATGVAAISAKYFLLVPVHSLFVASALDSLQIGVLVLGGALVSILAAAARTAHTAQSDQVPAEWVRAERKVQAVSAITLVCLSVIGVVSYASVAALQRDVALVAHTHEVIGSLHGLLATVTDAETAQRGYAITGQEPFLTPYRDAVRNLDGQMRQLRALTSDSTAQRRLTDQLVPLVTERMAAIARNIDIRRHQGFAAAQAVTASGTVV